MSFFFSEDDQILKTRSQLSYPRLYQLAGKVNCFLRKVTYSVEFLKIYLTLIAHVSVCTLGAGA